MWLERSNAKSQIAELWTDIIQRKIPVAYPNALRKLCLEAIDAMPGLTFASVGDRARTWGMLGSLYFKTTHLDWAGGFEGTEPCAITLRCYEEAFVLDPDPWWQQWIDHFSTGGAETSRDPDYAGQAAGLEPRQDPPHPELEAEPIAADAGERLARAALAGAVERVERHLREDGPFDAAQLNDVLQEVARVGPERREDSVAIARMLVEAGAWVDFQNELGDTAILHAVRGANLPLVKYLLEAGANPRLRNRSDDSAMGVAWFFDSEEGREVHNGFVAAEAKRKRKLKQANRRETKSQT